MGLPKAPERGRTARSRLEIDWDYPVYRAPDTDAAPGATVAERARFALPLEQAFAYIAGDDPRPLVVLRECRVCSGTDDALLSAEPDNERTRLLLRWFHCVKLPADVMYDENHPFHNLFAQGEDSPHLFVSDPDGKNFRPLESERSRTELWDALTEAIDRNYQKSPRASLKKLTKLLDQYDLVDRRIAEIEANIDSTIEKKGPRASKLRKLRRDLEEERAKMAKLDEEFAAALRLELKERRAIEGAGAKD